MCGLSSGSGMSGAWVACVGALVFSLLPLGLPLAVGSAIREEEERVGYDQVQQRPRPSLGSLVERKA